MVKFNNSSYVKALIDLGEEYKLTNLFYKNSINFINYIDKYPKLITYLSDYNVKKEKKHELINEIVRNSIYRKFLYVVIDEKRIIFIKKILKNYIKKIDLKNGLINGTIFTTNQLTHNKISLIEEKISKKLKKQIKLENIIDKELIAGLIIKVEDYLWDYSIKSQIKDLSNNLLNGRK